MKCIPKKKCSSNTKGDDGSLRSYVYFSVRANVSYNTLNKVINMQRITDKRHAHPFIPLLAGLCSGLLLSSAIPKHTPHFPETQPPLHISSLPSVPVSHSPAIKKIVLANYNDLPHVTQVRMYILALFWFFFFS